MRVRFIELVKNHLERIATLALADTELPSIGDDLFLSNHQYKVVERHLNYSDKLEYADIFIEKTIG